jgi:hypothetical protein
MKILTLAAFLVFGSLAFSQTPTTTDVFVMAGSDFVRPGLAAKANYNIGIGHQFSCYRKDADYVRGIIAILIGDEITASYTYENGGSGFFHSKYGSHTESLGVMNNLPLPKLKNTTLYLWPQIGITSMTGGSTTLNRLSGSYSAGIAYHMTPKHAIWVQESFNKVATVPWYTSTTIGYAYSF